MKQRKAAREKAEASRSRAVSPMKLYLLRHPEYGEATANGRTKYEAVLAVARKWGKPWTKIAREAEFIVLCDETAISDEEGPKNGAVM